MDETETKPQVRKYVTADDLARIDAALEKVQGHRGHAAAILGWDETRLRSAVNYHEELRVKWGRRPDLPPAGDLADDLDRPPPVLDQFSPQERKAALAIARQDELLQKTWKKVGFSPEQQEFLTTLQKSYSVSLKSTMDLTYGGMVHTATRLLMTFEDLVQKIKDVDEHPEKYSRTHMTQFGEVETKSAHEYRCELYDRLISISAEMRKVHTDVTKAQYVRAQLDALRGNTQGTGAKPGWAKGVAPAAVQVNISAPKGEVSVTPAAEPVIETP